MLLAECDDFLRNFTFERQCEGENYWLKLPGHEIDPVLAGAAATAARSAALVVGLLRTGSDRRHELPAASVPDTQCL